MEYTEEVKKEADSVVNEKLIEITFYVKPHHEKMVSIKLAIQDRQSVLDAIKKIDHDYNLSNEIQFLTQQIEYLKTKI